MLIVDDTALMASGLDYATALALLKPGEGETVVHVTRIPVDGGEVVRLTFEEEPASFIGDDGQYQATLDDVPTEEPPTPAADPAAEGQDVYTADDDDDDDDDTPGRMLRGLTGEIPQSPRSDIPNVPPANLLGIPRLLPERHYSLGDVQRVASALRCVVQAERDGSFQLVGTFGHALLPTLAAVAECLNKRSFHIGD